jgi:mRNA interferase MazF
VIARGELWWADLGPPAGSAPGHRRPVLIVSADAYNQSRIQTVLALAVTSNLRLAMSPGNVSLDAGDGGLDRPSVVNVTQVVTIDKNRLTERIDRLDPAAMELVDAGLRRSLGL